MKVDVITMHAVNNYGSVLQAFATQEFFRQHGCDARLINAVFPHHKPYRRFLQALSGGSKYTMPLRILPAFLAVYKSFKVFNRFRNKYLRMSNDKQYTTPEDFAKYESDADAFCTGGDQVWTPYYPEAAKPMWHLSFIPDESFKFAFSSSFGVNELPEEEVRKFQKYISSYRYISVREDTGLKILREQFHYENAAHLLDPTLCLNGDMWRRYAKILLFLGGGRGTYILLYILHTDKKINDYAEALSKKTGLKLIRACSSWRQFKQNLFRHEKKIILPDVFRFLSLIDSARYVITNSFHGTAFSLNLNTEPICIYPDKTGGRIESLLRLTHTLHRHAESYDDFDIINRPVNWDEVNSILDGERRKASEWLKMVFADIQRQKA